MTQETLESSSLLYTSEEFKILSDDIKDDFVEEVAQIMFKAGAAWQRNHVWHKNTEMPSREVNEDGIGRPCMVQEGTRVFLCYACRSTIGKYYFTDNAGIWHQIDSIDTWAYLADLMPTSFDEIMEENKDVLQRLKERSNND